MTNTPHDSKSIDERLDETSQGPTDHTDHFRVNNVMISLGFKWDNERETWYNEDNVWMYQKAAVNLVTVIHTLFLDLVAEAKPKPSSPDIGNTAAIFARVDYSMEAIDQYENNLKQAIGEK